MRRVMTSSRKAMKAAMIVAQGHLLGPAAVQRQHVDAKARLQRGVAVELVQDDVGLGVALQFDDDAQPVAVALVAQIGDALDQLLADASRRCARLSFALLTW